MPYSAIHHRDLITPLLSSSACFNCSQPSSFSSTAVPHHLTAHTARATVWKKGTVRSLTHLCLLKQSCGNHPSKSSLISLWWSRSPELFKHMGSNQATSNLTFTSDVWNSSVSPFLPVILIYTCAVVITCNFNPYMSFPWNIITLLKRKFLSLYIRKITLWQKMWKSLIINLPHHLQEIP